MVVLSWRLLPITLPLVALVMAEELTSLFDPQVGLAVYGGLMAGLILHTALIWRRPFYKLFLSLTVIPLVRILSLSLPLASFPLVYWYLIVSIPLFMAVFLITRTVGFSWKQIGLDLKKLPIQGLTAFTGLAFGYVKYQLLRPEPLVQALTWEQLWLPALILLVCTGFAEELLFRGVMQRAATEAMGSLGGFYVAALFAVMKTHRIENDAALADFQRPCRRPVDQARTSAIVTSLADATYCRCRSRMTAVRSLSRARMLFS